MFYCSISCRIEQHLCMSENVCVCAFAVQSKVYILNLLCYAVYFSISTAADSNAVILLCADLSSNTFDSYCLRKARQLYD